MSDGYEVLFEQIKIGPVMAPNRFYQVPHCNGMGHLRPRADAATRGVKAQGGWVSSARRKLKFIQALIYLPMPKTGCGMIVIFLPTD